MKVNLKEPIFDIKGNPIKKIDDNGKQIEELLTIGDVITNALMTVLESDGKATAADKIQRYDIAKKCNSDTFIELKTDELAKIKSRINETYPNPLIIGEFDRIIEG